MNNKEELNKTIKAHGTTSEIASEKKASNIEKTTESMIKKIETEEKEIEKKKIIEKEKEIEAEEVLEKEREEEIKKVRFARRGELTPEELLKKWEPKTKLGKDVKSGKIKNIDEILDKNLKILEPEIVDSLIQLESDLISVGQSKGKFGGGKRRAWRQTQRKTGKGNVPTFSTMAVVGDKNGHVGIGSGKSKETLPARDKSIRKAKLSIIKIGRTCASFDCQCDEKHTVPFEILGKSGSVRVKLIPAPQGTGLVVANELKKVLALAGIKDVYSRTTGSQRTTFNLIKACIDALKKTAKEGDKK